MQRWTRRGYKWKYAISINKAQAGGHCDCHDVPPRRDGSPELARLGPNIQDCGFFPCFVGDGDFLLLRCLDISPSRNSRFCAVVLLLAKVSYPPSPIAYLDARLGSRSRPSPPLWNGRARGSTRESPPQLGYFRPGLGKEGTSRWRATGWRFPLPSTTLSNRNFVPRYAGDLLELVLSSTWCRHSRALASTTFVSKLRGEMRCFLLFSSLLL